MNLMVALLDNHLCCPSFPIPGPQHWFGLISRGRRQTEKLLRMWVWGSCWLTYGSQLCWGCGSHCGGVVGGLGVGDEGGWREFAGGLVAVRAAQRHTRGDKAFPLWGSALLFCCPLWVFLPLPSLLLASLLWSPELVPAVSRATLTRGPETSPEAPAPLLSAQGSWLQRKGGHLGPPSCHGGWWPQGSGSSGLWQPLRWCHGVEGPEPMGCQQVS